jgi:VWFA-related protein
MALALVAAAQDSSPQTTFTSNSELVLVPVQVMDRAGQPLHGLKRGDFVLDSDGQAQQLAVFDEVRRSTQVIVPSHKAETTTPPTTFSNLPAEGMPHELVIIAIDQLNTVGYLQQWVRGQVIQYLRAHPPQQPTALVLIASGGLLEFQAPTLDSEALIKAVQHMQLRGDMFRPELTPDMRTGFRGRPGEYAAMMADLEEKRSAQLAVSLREILNTMRSFQQIAKAYEGVPGRKTVLWFTTGFPALKLEAAEPPLFGKPGPPHPAPVTSLRHTGQDLLPEFQQAFAALNRANVVLYPIDLAGFASDRLWNAWSDSPATSPYPGPVPFVNQASLANAALPGNPSVGLVQPTPISPPGAHPTQFSWIFGNGMCPGPIFSVGPVSGGGCGDDPGNSWLHRIGEKVVARSTGGEPCDAGRHIEHCVEQASLESNGYYVLGFYVPQRSRKEGWHELNVHVSGDHGTVRTRSGYYLEGSGPAPQAKETRSVDDAIIANLEYTGIVFNVERGKRDDAAGMVPFRVSVPSSSIVKTPAEDRLSFDIVSVPISGHGTAIPNAGRITKIDMNHDTMTKALVQGWKLVDKAFAPTTAIAVKVVVRDNLSGRIGTVVFPLGQDVATPDVRPQKNGATLEPPTK